MTSHRQELALRLVRSADRTSLEDLATRLGVSQMTVRRDLDALERQGLVQRVRGGAVPLHPRLHAAPPVETAPPAPRSPVRSPVPEPQATDDVSAARSATERIARAVAATISPGSSVLLDAGPLAAAVAAELPRRAPLTVVVMGLPAAAALAGSPGISVLVLGGLLDADGTALGGPLAAAALAALDVDVLVASTLTAHPATGWAAATLEGADLARAAMARAGRTVVAAGSGQLGVRSLARVAPLDAVAAVVTDAGVHDPSPAGGPLPGGSGHSVPFPSTAGHRSGGEDRAARATSRDLDGSATTVLRALGAAAVPVTVV